MTSDATQGSFPSDSNLSKVAVVEDETAVAEILVRILKELGVKHVDQHDSVQDFLDHIDEDLPELVFTDLLMPGRDGFDLIKEMQSRHPQVPIIVVSAHASLDNAVKAVKLGAFDFVAKPFDVDGVSAALQKAMSQRYVRQRLQGKPVQLQQDRYLNAILGNSAAMTSLREMIAIAREVEANVLVEGETGTGKELVAHALHGGAGPFVALNVATIADDIAESELFGHKQGAFTGAVSNRKGILESAIGGVLFLDEINSMTQKIQVQLLRAIQERKVRPIGSNREVDVKFRLICATNEPLEDAVASGRFRLDLYHRINLIHIRIPPLRERPEDIPDLAREFFARYCQLHHRPVSTIEDSAISALRQYEWPGNVRELENVIERAVIFSSAEENLSIDVLSRVFSCKNSGQALTTGFTVPLTLTMKELEVRYSRAVLDEVGGNKSEATRILKIDYKTLERRLKETKT
ncbi:sigma-54-dependent transcriptional regulator [Sedimenticola thiotaurini]|uniref:sigma-54-dependent transcriptional regulator n=1 Tax=Sedimenticola thiotaurini TaxID=1543721 RepID=UPI000699922C|nr:sigma-54 dependent transcriptional regulator [Sedimenticola thiotaurini]